MYFNNITTGTRDRVHKIFSIFLCMWSYIVSNLYAIDMIHRDFQEYGGISRVECRHQAGHVRIDNLTCENLPGGFLMDKIASGASG
jgi:hypothetical protein